MEDRLRPGHLVQPMPWNPCVPCSARSSSACHIHSEPYGQHMLHTMYRAGLTRHSTHSARAQNRMHTACSDLPDQPCTLSLIHSDLDWLQSDPQCYVQGVWYQVQPACYIQDMGPESVLRISSATNKPVHSALQAKNWPAHCLFDTLALHIF